MIELNLLPEELRIKKIQKIELPDIPIIPIGIGIAVLLVTLHLVTVLFAARNKNVLTHVKTKWEAYLPQKKELDLLAKQVSDAKRKIKAIEDLTKGRILWSEIMNNLSHAVLANIWLSKLSYEDRNAQPVLLLEGYALGSSDEGTASVGRFINALEDNKGFFPYFRDIELESIRRDSIDGKEIMQFRLICVFKE